MRIDLLSPLGLECRQLLLEIELLPASDQATKCSVMCSALLEKIAAISRPVNPGEPMKRQVWVECEFKERHVSIPREHDGPINLKRAEIHESRWIPVGERMPTVAEHYLVVRLDRLDWCYCERVLTDVDQREAKVSYVFTSKGVTHWLEAPPLPVEEKSTKLSWPMFDDPPEGYCKTDVVAWVHQAKIGKEKRLCRMFHRTEPRGESHILESFCWVPFEEVIAIS